jgi:hypothetical protein
MNLAPEMPTGQRFIAALITSRFYTSGRFKGLFFIGF